MRKTVLLNKMVPLLRQHKSTSLFRVNQMFEICLGKDVCKTRVTEVLVDTSDVSNSSATRTLFPTASNLLPTPFVRTLDAGIHHFLPRGYATGAVPVRYFDYTKWSVGAAVASSAAMVLSTQSLLYAIGCLAQRVRGQ